MLKLKSLYDNDFNLWAENQAAALRSNRLEDLDRSNLIEEIEDLARRDKKALRSYLKVLFLHLLKWQYQPDKRSKSWKISISNARIEIEDILLDSPNLRNYLSTVVDQSCVNALRLATDETNLAIEAFPIECAYTLAEALALDFLP
jgi:hypothetical protein